jgi:hypothetical protein
VVAQATARPLELVVALCAAFRDEGVRYCHWKSTTTLELAERGEGDLDLLVDRRCAQRFLEILRRLGFKEARGEREIPGVFHAYALDAPSGRLVHVHAHYALVLGDDMTKNYRLPVEDAYLASARQGAVFQVPAPEFELAVLVIRLVLKHAAWDAILIGLGPLKPGERRELEDLEQRAGAAAVGACVRTHLPFVGEAVWDDCRRALDSGAGPWFRIRTARRLEACLASHARRPWLADSLFKLVRRASGFLVRRLTRKRRTRRRLDSGGALIAIVGGDEAVRSTLAAGLHGWLARDLESATVRLGTPSGGGRDRARRLAAAGTLVVCDGYPAPQRWAGIEGPDVLIVLRTAGGASDHPGEHHADGRGTPSFVLDAGRPPEELLGELKRCVWASL